MPAKSKAELMRESRKRKRDAKTRDSDEFLAFLRVTPFASETLEGEKMKAFLELQKRLKRDSAKRQADTIRKREARLKEVNRLKFVKTVLKAVRDHLERHRLEAEELVNWPDQRMRPCVRRSAENVPNLLT